MNALILEDKKEFVERLKAHLLSDIRGIEFSVAHNHQTAMELFNRIKPVVVIIDIRQPDKNRLGLIKMMKRQVPETAIVILTDYSFELFREECLQAGADFFIDISFELDKLSVIIKKIAERIDVELREF